MYLLWLKNRSNVRSSRLQMFFRIRGLKNFAIFTGKHLCWSLFLITNLLKRDSNTVEIFKSTLFYRTPLLAASVMHQQLNLQDLIYETQGSRRSKYYQIISKKLYLKVITSTYYWLLKTVSNDEKLRASLLLFFLTILNTTCKFSCKHKNYNHQVRIFFDIPESE